jgi:putative cell wall-associated protein
MIKKTMKRITPLALIMLNFCFSVTMCSQQKKENSNWNDLKLKGNVKTIIEVSYPNAYEDEKGEFERGLTKEIYYYLQDDNRDINKLMDSLSTECTDAFIFVYNKGGNLLKTERFKARGSYVGQAGSAYEYNSEGKLVLAKGSDSEFMTMYGSKSVSFLKNYKYDFNGRLSEETNTITIGKIEEGGSGESMEGIEGDKCTENTMYVYNEKGQKVEENFYISKGYLSKDDGFLSGRYEENYKLPYEKKFKYDEKGRLYEEEEKTLTVKNTGYYSLTKKVTNEITTIKTLYKYDEKNRVQFKNTQSDTNEEEKYLYTYDEYGNITSEQHYKLGRISDNITYIYKYDKQGNWIEKSTYTNGELNAVNKRTITYY